MKELTFVIGWGGENIPLVHIKGEAIFGSDVALINSVSTSYSGDVVICLSATPEGIYRDDFNQLWINKPTHKKTVRVWPVLSEVEKNAMEVADAMDGLKVEVAK
jgi:hypothetical protein